MQPVISQSRRTASLTLLTSVNPSLPRHVSRPLDVETEAVIERYYILAPQPGPRFFGVRKRLEEKAGCCRENKRGSSTFRSQFAFFVDGLGPVSLFFSYTEEVQAPKRQENEMGKREFVARGREEKRLEENERMAEKRGWKTGENGGEGVLRGRGKARRGWPFNICSLHLADFPGKIDATVTSFSRRLLN